MRRVPIKFPCYFTIRLSPELYAAIDREARANQQTHAAYLRAVLLAHFKAHDVRVRPIRATAAKPPLPQAEAAA
jgi:hypothetical protein